MERSAQDAVAFKARLARLDEWARAERTLAVARRVRTVANRPALVPSIGRRVLPRAVQGLIYGGLDTAALGALLVASSEARRSLVDFLCDTRRLVLTGPIDDWARLAVVAALRSCAWLRSLVAEPTFDARTVVGFSAGLAALVRRCRLTLEEVRPDLADLDPRDPGPYPKTSGSAPLLHWASLVRLPRLRRWVPLPFFVGTHDTLRSRHVELVHLSVRAPSTTCVATLAAIRAGCWPTLRVLRLVVGSVSLLPDLAAACQTLEELDVGLTPAWGADFTQTLVRAGPLLRRLTLRFGSGLPSIRELMATLYHFGSAALARAAATPVTLAGGTLMVSHLEELVVEVATDAGFADLTFPRLVRFEARGPMVQIARLAELLGRMPALRNCKLVRALVRTGPLPAPPPTSVAAADADPASGAVQPHVLRLECWQSLGPDDLLSLFRAIEDRRSTRLVCVLHATSSGARLLALLREAQLSLRCLGALHILHETRAACIPTADLTAMLDPQRFPALLELEVPDTSVSSDTLRALCAKPPNRLAVLRLYPSLYPFS